MAPSGKNLDRRDQPALADLLAGYLQRQTAAQAEGLGTADTQEVVPHEAGPVQPIDPKLAWTETLEVLPFYSSNGEVRPLKAPPDWPVLVAGLEPQVAVAFCLGNFPQLVRNLQPLLHGKDLGQLKPSTGRPLAVSALETWSAQTSKQHRFPECLLALAGCRLARQFDRADALAAEQKEIPAEWKVAWENERAALLWHRGQAAEALKMWQSQESSVPVLFNRGMASLFLNKRPAARSCLNQAVSQIPEASSWHHLGRLYLALAEMGD